jgi:hypothetical protein
MNDTFKKFISWLEKVEMRNVMENFNLWCGSSNVDEIVDNTQIFKFLNLLTITLKNYYYHKTIRHSIIVEVVIDCNK